jgi:hypothetical protein
MYCAVVVVAFRNSCVIKELGLSLGAFANLRKATFSFVMSVHMEQLGCH